MASYLVKDGGLSQQPRRVTFFRGMMDDCRLRNLATKGVSYTWWNKRGEGEAMRERIDRFLANSDWVFACPMSLVNQLPMVGSDHSPLVLHISFQDKIGKRLFRFELVWAREKECTEVVKEAWNTHVNGPYGFRFVKKLRICKGKLISWSKKFSSNAAKGIGSLMKELEVL